MIKKKKVLNNKEDINNSNINMSNIIIDNNTNEIYKETLDNKLINNTNQNIKEVKNNVAIKSGSEADKLRMIVSQELSVRENLNLLDLEEDDLDIARDLAFNVSDDSICFKYKIAQNKLNLVKKKPAVIDEMLKVVNEETLSNETMRIRNLSSIAMQLAGSIDFNDISSKDKVKLFKEYSDSITKINEGRKVSKESDIVMLIKELNINQNDINKSNDGKIQFKSKFVDIANELKD
jgi:hypothetical protein